MESSHTPVLGNSPAIRVQLRLICRVYTTTLNFSKNKMKYLHLAFNLKFETKFISMFNTIEKESFHKILTVYL